MRKLCWLFVMPVAVGLAGMSYARAQEAPRPIDVIVTVPVVADNLHPDITIVDVTCSIGSSPVIRPELGVAPGTEPWISHQIPVGADGSINRSLTFELSYSNQDRAKIIQRRLDAMPVYCGLSLTTGKNNDPSLPGGFRRVGANTRREPGYVYEGSYWETRSLVYYYETERLSDQEEGFENGTR